MEKGSRHSKSLSFFATFSWVVESKAEVVDGPRLTEVWCSVWVASALVLWQTPSPGYSRQLVHCFPPTALQPLCS
eukprot:g33202.t1